MSQQTGISWADSTFNPWMGCTKVSPACDHCYAERDTKRLKRVQWGAGQPRVRTSAGNWKLPERWNRTPFFECDCCGARGTLGELMNNAVHYPNPKFYPARRRVFCASLADVFDNEAPIDWLADLLDLIRRTPNLDWLLLTKRIGNWKSRLNGVMSLGSRGTNAGYDTQIWTLRWLDGSPPPNVWIGATVINQDEADRDVPKLLAVPARVRFLSIEPMLGPIDLTAIKHTPSPGYFGDCLQWYHQPHGADAWHGIHWIICGGESGPHARPMHPDWVRSLRGQCVAAGVPFHFKQWGEWISEEDSHSRNIAPSAGNDDFPDMPMVRVGKKAAGRLLDGRTWSGFPRA